MSSGYKSAPSGAGRFSRRSFLHEISDPVDPKVRPALAREKRKTLTRLNKKPARA